MVEMRERERERGELRVGGSIFCCACVAFCWFLFPCEKSLFTIFNGVIPAFFLAVES